MPPAADAPRKVAVLIGQNRFPASSQLTDLAFAEADMTAIGDLLTATPGQPYDEVIRIPSGSSHDAFVQLEEAASQLRHDDTFMVYYSGHGVRDRRRRLYLAFENTNEERLSSTAIKVGNILDLLQSHNARRRVLVLDCCYAGAVGAEFDRSGLSEQVANEVQGAGTVVITSATKTEIAREDPELGQGIFTRHFIDGLAGAADADGDGTITSEELFQYVHEKVSRQTNQKPQRFNHEIEGRIVLRETGLTPWKDKSNAIRTTLLTLAKSGEMSDRYLQETLKIAGTPPTSLSTEERKLFHLIENLDPGSFRAGQFLNAWDAQMAKVNAKPPPRPHPMPSEPEQPREEAGFAEATNPWGKPTADWISRIRGDRPEAPAGPNAPAPDATPRAASPPSKGGLGFLGWRSKEPVPNWYANLSVIVGFLVPLFMVQGRYVFFASWQELGTALIFWSGLCIFSAHSRWSGGAMWRKIAYYAIATIFGLAGLGYLLGIN